MLVICSGTHPQAELRRLVGFYSPAKSLCAEIGVQGYPGLLLSASAGVLDGTTTTLLEELRKFNGLIAFLM